MTDYLVLSALLAAALCWAGWRELGNNNRRDAALLFGAGVALAGVAAKLA